MNIRSLLTLIFAATLPLHVQQASAEEESGFYADIQVDMFSHYMWRGLNLYDHFSVQPYSEFGYTSDLGTLSGLIWTHFPVGGGDSEERYVENDYGLWYTAPVDVVHITVGHLWYTYPRSKDDISSYGEFFLSLGAEYPLAMVDFRPSASLYYDYDYTDGLYYELLLEGDVALNDEGDIFVTPRIELGFASRQEEFYAKSGFVQSTIGLGLTKAFGDLHITPSLHYTYGRDELLENQLWGGVSVGYSF